MQSDSESRSLEFESLISSCLFHFDYENAIVQAEAYFNLVKTDNALNILCQALMRNNQLNAAYCLLKSHGVESAKSRYLFAKCAFDLKRLEEAESCLRDRKTIDRVSLHPCFTNTDSFAYAQDLLAKILFETGRMTTAKTHWKLALTANPFRWTSIKSYCDMGGESINQLFSNLISEISETKSDAKNQEKKSDRDLKSSRVNDIVTDISPSKKTPPNNFQLNNIPSAPRKKPVTGGNKKKPIPSPTSINSSTRRRNDIIETRRSTRLFNAQENENKDIPSRYSHYSHRTSTARNATGMKELRSVNRMNSSRERLSPVSSAIIPLDNKLLFENSPDENKIARRTHIYPLSSVNSAVSDLIMKKALPNSLSSSTNSLASNRKEDFDEEPMDVENTQPANAHSTKSKDKSDGSKKNPIYGNIADWIVQISEVQQYLSKFSCEEALDLILALPVNFAQLPLSLELHARILFENGEYKRASVIFEELHRLHPQRVEGLEVWSTALWHLQDVHKLSALAAELTEQARERPEAWCVAGNCYSVLKQHDTAIECLERAIRLNSRFGYAYTLLGHELVEINDLNRASQAFRHAILYSPNDYKAFYGLGLVDYKSQQLSLARYNLMRAVRINPKKPILLCQLSVIEAALHNQTDAMSILNTALKYAPNNVACRYHKARLLFDMKRFNDALKELQELKVLSPDEANVFFLLGRVYRKLGNTHQAMVNFSWATEIDPRGDQNHSTITDQGYSLDDDPIDDPNDSNQSDSSFF